MNIRILTAASLSLLLAAALSGCGDGGGGSSVTSPGTGGTTVTPGATNLETGLSALNASTPNYESAKVQFNQVVSNPEATSSDRTAAYSGLGWAGFKGASGTTDINAAVDNFNQALTVAQNGGVSASTVSQARVGMASARMVKGSEDADNSQIGAAITDLDAAGYADTGKAYSDDIVKTGISNEEMRGYKAFLHYMRAEGDDDAQFAANMAKVGSSPSNRNAQLMYDALSAISK